nr:superoxide dismutase family protein [Bdellovibrio sp. HM001]
MKNMLLIGLVSLSMAACAQKEKAAETHHHDHHNHEAAAAAPQKAQAVLKTVKGSKLKGIIHFTEENGKMKIETMVEGIKPGPHGFHIHENGDCSAADFSSAGGHFNPSKGTHAGHDVAGRHVGDLGNLVADNKSKANTTLIVDGMTMKGPESIIGKAVVIHKDKDDLKSQPAGNSGARIACGVIEAL